MKLSEYFGWKVKLGIFLVILSALLYVANYFIFHDLHGVLFYIGIDIAFLPIEILFVVLVIQNAISSREKKQMMEKLNMVIGAFFSELGTDLLGAITKFDPDTEHIKDDLLINNNWSEKDFKRAKKAIQEFEYTQLIIIFPPVGVVSKVILTGGGNTTVTLSRLEGTDSPSS